MTTREEVLNLLQGILDTRNAQEQLEKEIKNAEEEEKPVLEKREVLGNEQAERYKEIITTYDLTSTKIGNGMVSSVDLYGIELFKMIYDDRRKSIGYGVTSTAKEFINWDSATITQEIQNYILVEFPELRKQLAELQVKKSKTEYLLARAYAQLHITSFLELKTKRTLKREIQEYREELLKTEKTIEPLEKRANKLSDPKMKELLAEAYQVQESLKECLKYESEYTTVWDDWRDKKSNIRILKLKEEELKNDERTIVSDLIHNPDRVNELINISKSHKVDSKSRKLAKEVIKSAARYHVVGRN